MKLKEGDIVLLKSWDRLLKEYNYDENKKRLIINGLEIYKDMEKFLRNDRIAIIRASEKEPGEDFNKVKFMDCSYIFYEMVIDKVITKSEYPQYFI